MSKQVNVNVKESFLDLLKNNEIEKGRIITNPLGLSKNQIDTSMSFNEIDKFENEFTFYDDEETTRGDDSGIFKINFSFLEKVIYFNDKYYKKFNAMLYFKDNSQVQFAFNLKNEEDIPPLWETAVSKGSLYNVKNSNKSDNIMISREKFANLMKQGNNVISGGVLGFNIDTRDISQMEFDDIYVIENLISFSYTDKDNDNECWRGERAPMFTLYNDDILDINQVNHRGDDLYGKYTLKLKLQNNMELFIYFDVVDGVDLTTYGLDDSINNVSYADEFDLYNDNKKKWLDSIFSHNGSFLINVNSGDFTELQSLEVYNLVFTNVKPLHNNSLLSFDNSTMRPVGYDKEANVPIYPMDFSTNFYVDLKKMITLEEIDDEEIQDIFEYPTTRIFNLRMKDKSIVTIGLYGGSKVVA